MFYIIYGNLFVLSFRFFQDRLRTNLGRFTKRKTFLLSTKTFLGKAFMALKITGGRGSHKCLKKKEKPQVN
jgi:hypothetical protein